MPSVKLIASALRGELKVFWRSVNGLGPAVLSLIVLWGALAASHGLWFVTPALLAFALAGYWRGSADGLLRGYAAGYARGRRDARGEIEE